MSLIFEIKCLWLFELVVVSKIIYFFLYLIVNLLQDEKCMPLWVCEREIIFLSLLVLSFILNIINNKECIIIIFHLKKYGIKIKIKITVKCNHIRGVIKEM